MMPFQENRLFCSVELGFFCNFVELRRLQLHEILCFVLLFLVKDELDKNVVLII